MWDQQPCITSTCSQTSPPLQQPGCCCTQRGSERLPTWESESGHSEEGSIPSIPAIPAIQSELWMKGYYHYLLQAPEDTSLLGACLYPSSVFLPLGKGVPLKLPSSCCWGLVVPLALWTQDISPWAGDFSSTPPFLKHCLGFIALIIKEGPLKYCPGKSCSTEEVWCSTNRGEGTAALFFVYSALIICCSQSSASS